MFSYSVFIPRVFSNIKEQRICNVFHNLNIGSVDHVDLVAKKTSGNGASYNMAFVHFAMIYNTAEANQFRQALEGDEKKTTVQYDGQWFWLVLPFEQKDKPNEDPPHLPQSSLPVMYPPSMEYMMANMKPIWLMTPHGPILQWGCPHNTNTTTASTETAATTSTHVTLNKRTNTAKMVPPQIAYKNLNVKQRQHPRKKINAPRVESRSYTYTKEHNEISTNVTDHEEGEISEDDE